MSNYSRPRNRESRTKRSRMTEPVTVSFDLTREEWDQAQTVMRRYGLSIEQVFRKGIEAVQPS